MRIVLLLSALLVLSNQPSSDEIRLVVKADDMGAAHGVNVGTIDAYVNGIVTTTNVIVPGPWFPEAARMLKQHPGLDVGVHLALTSEWENVKWRPVTQAPSIVDADGYFFPMVVPRQGFPPQTSLREAQWKLDEIERELRGQLDLAKRHLPQATYTWYHMGFTMLAPEVRELAAKLTKEYGLIEPMALGIKPIGRVWDGKDTGLVKADKLAARLETLEPGLWLHIDHGSTNDAEMQAIHHLGYEWVAADRSANVEAWKSPKVREVVRRRGIKLVGYKDLAN